MSMQQRAWWRAKRRRGLRLVRTPKGYHLICHVSNMPTAAEVDEHERDHPEAPR